MSDTVQIFLANARRDDSEAMAKLLSPLRDGGAVARSLESEQSGYAFGYDPQARVARFIVSDGTLASCFSVVGVSRDEAASISKACETKTDWSFNSFQATVARVLGGAVARVN
jgi:hypothetical protein